MVELGVETPTVFEMDGELASDVSSSNKALVVVAVLLGNCCVIGELVTYEDTGLAEYACAPV